MLLGFTMVFDILHTTRVIANCGVAEYTQCLPGQVNFPYMFTQRHSSSPNIHMLFKPHPPEAILAGFVDLLHKQFIISVDNSGHCCALECEMMKTD